VAIRRVSPDFERMKKLAMNQWEKMRGREVVPPVEYMEKLKSRKAEVGDQIDRSRAATRYEAPPPSDIASVPNVVEDLMAGGTAAARPAAERRPQAQAPGLAPTGPQPEAESYTNRLLKAKNKVWEDREKDGKDKGKS
jgi:hypothetical protein